MFDYIIFAIHLPTGKAEIFGTKFLGPTDYNGSRFKYQRTNAVFVRHSSDKPKTVSWNHDASNQTEQLQIALGKDWKVLEQWELLRAIQKSEAKF